MRKTISTHTPSEKRVGYSRAVLIGKTIYVSGTTSQNEKGNVIGKTVEEQAMSVFQKIKTVISKAGFSKEDIVLITAYITDMKQLSGFDTAFKKEFFDVKPACTMIGVSELVDKNFLIEVSCIAQKE